MLTFLMLRTKDKTLYFIECVELFLILCLKVELSFVTRVKVLLQGMIGQIS